MHGQPHIRFNIMLYTFSAVVISQNPPRNITYDFTDGSIVICGKAERRWESWDVVVDVSRVVLQVRWKFLQEYGPGKISIETCWGTTHMPLECVNQLYAHQYLRPRTLPDISVNWFCSKVFTYCKQVTCRRRWHKCYYRSRDEMRSYIWTELCLWICQALLIQSGCLICLRFAAKCHLRA